MLSLHEALRRTTSLLWLGRRTRVQLAFRDDGGRCCLRAPTAPCSCTIQASMTICSRGRCLHATATPKALAHSFHVTSRGTAAVCRSVSNNSNSIHYGEDHQACIPPPPTICYLNWKDGLTPGDGDSPSRLHSIFCNRTLDLASVSTIGFDMDYTLAQYKPETFELLAYTETIKKLVQKFDYPIDVSRLEFDWRYMMRGLTIDKERGNIIKIDRHKYVKIAYHGLSELAPSRRKEVYSSGIIRDSFDGPGYTTIDTLFSLAEAYLFMQIVDLKDSGRYEILKGKQYATIYREIRGAVDLCHRDGSLKEAVASNPEKYIHPDPRLLEMIEMYKLAGKKLFVATNSLWDYTHVVMNYLLYGYTGSSKTDDWLGHFDMVMTGCSKPAFFTEQRPLFQVNTKDASLLNTDGGSPIIPIGEEDLPPSWQGGMDPLTRRPRHLKVYQGGSVSDLHSMLGVRNGSEVLYIGDHIYGDILRSKKTMGWRTMLIVPELGMELRLGQQSQNTMLELKHLRLLRDTYDDRIQRLKWALDVLKSHDESEVEAVREELERFEAISQEVLARHKQQLKSHHETFHPIWGQLMKTGYQSSKYAHLLERFACLYTSHVSNLAFYSPTKKFRGRLDVMAHEEEFLNEVADIDIVQRIDAAPTR